MRALRVERPGEPGEVLRLRSDVPVPEPGPGMVRVRVEAAALNLPDVLLCRGSYQLHPEFPFTPGLEACGVVVAVGPGVEHRVIGQRMVATPELPHGGLAEAAIFRSQSMYPVPDEVTSLDAAATLIPFNTAHVALHHRANLRAGEVLLVHAGAGGTGSAAVQLGVLAGARVIATAGGPDKVELCRKLGAHEVIDYVAEDFVEQVKELTHGAGADVVFDPVGGQVFDRSRRCTAVDGRLLVVGFAGGELQTIPANHALYKSYSVVGVYMGAYRNSETGRAMVAGVHREVMQLLVQRRIQPVIARVIGLEEVPEALTELGSRRTMGKTVVNSFAG